MLYWMHLITFFNPHEGTKLNMFVTSVNKLHALHNNLKITCHTHIFFSIIQNRNNFIHMKTGFNIDLRSTPWISDILRENSTCFNTESLHSCIMFENFPLLQQICVDLKCKFTQSKSSFGGIFWVDMILWAKVQHFPELISWELLSTL